MMVDQAEVVEKILGKINSELNTTDSNELDKLEQMTDILFKIKSLKR